MIKIAIPRPQKRTSKLLEKPPVLKRKHQVRNFRTWNFFTFLFSGSFFPLLDQNPNPADLNQCESGSTTLSKRIIFCTLTCIKSKRKGHVSRISQKSPWLYFIPAWRYAMKKRLQSIFCPRAWCLRVLLEHFSLSLRLGSTLFRHFLRFTRLLLLLLKLRQMITILF